jgi:hypothetical protein
MVDEYTAEDMGSKKAFLEGIVGGVEVAAYVGAYLAANLPFVPGPVALVGEVALFAMDEPGALTENGTWQLIKSGFQMAEDVQNAVGSMLNPINHLAAAAGIVSDVINGEFGPESMMEAFDTITGGGDDEEFEEGGGEGEHAVAGAASKSTKAKAALRKWISKPYRSEKVTVYAIFGKNGKPIYFGITNDLVRRGAEHGMKLQAVFTIRSRRMARAAETFLMIRHATLGNMNKIRSVGKDRDFYEQAIAFGERLVRRVVKDQRYLDGF